MAQSKVIKHAHDGGTYKLMDGDGAQLVVRFDSADLAISGITPELRETTHYEGRGMRRSSRLGKRKYPTITFSVQVANLSESTVGECADWVFGRAPFNALVSTDDRGELKTFTFEFTQIGVNGEDDETLTVQKLHITEASFAEGEPNKWTFSGEVLGSVGINGVVAALAPEDD